MNADLLTQLVRATNDGVVPAPLQGEDMDTFKLRAAIAGAVVGVHWYVQAKAAEAAAEKERASEAAKHGHGANGHDDAGFSGTGLIEHADGPHGEYPPVHIPSRPGDVTVTSPGSPNNPVKAADIVAEVARRRGKRLDVLTGATPRAEAEIGVD